MHSTKNLRFLAGVTILVGLASLAATHAAQASPGFPPVLAAAIAAERPAAVKCVPLCTACHLTTTGGPGMLNVFGAALESKYGLRLENNASVATAIKADAAAMADADGDGTSDIDELIVGDSPSIAGPLGKNQFCPDIQYGCGARIAAPPPTDRLSLFSAGLVVFGFALAHRRKKGVRAQRLAR
jgi:hypothetical protein